MSRVTGPDRLTWYCNICDKPILGSTQAKAAGWVWIGDQDIRDTQANNAEIKARGKDRGPLRIWCGADLANLRRARWRVTCRGCDPGEAEPDRSHYPVHELATVAQVLARTLHLFGKNWMRDTDWIDSIGYPAYTAATTSRDAA